MFKTMMLGAAASVALLAAPAVAQSTDVTFSLTSGGASVANGSFSYLDTKSGVLNYTDLTSFSFFDGSHTYDLADVLANSGSDYQYLGYQTGTQSFVSTSVGGFTFYITSTDASTEGFYTDDGSASGLNPGNPFVYDYISQSSVSYDAISVTSAAGAVPEPATWAMMLVGFGMVGFGLRRRAKQAVRVTYA